jgi:hypothetical protein
MKTLKLSTRSGSALGEKKLIVSTILAIAVGVFLFSGTAFADEYYYVDLNGGGVLETIKMTEKRFDGSGFDPDYWRDHLFVYDGVTGTELWNHVLSEEHSDNPLFQDLDGDDDMEIIVMSTKEFDGSGFDPNYWRDNLYVFDYDGYKWSHVLSEKYSDNPLFQDLDGDDDMEIIVMSTKEFDGSGFDPNYWCDNLYVFDYDGYEWSYVLSENNSYIRVFADLDRNGGMEIVVESSQKFDGAAFDPDYWREKLYVFDHGGYCSSMVDSNRDNYSKPAIANMDSDTDLEIVVTADYKSGGTWYDKLYIWNYDGSLVTSKTISSSTYPTVYDNDGDWRPEVFSGLAQIHESSHQTTNRSPWPSIVSGIGIYTSYAISGTVQYSSPNNGDVTNATLSIGPHQIATDGNGDYIFDDFCDGDYTVGISVPSYSSLPSQPVTISGDDVPLNFIVPSFCSRP